MIDLSNTFWPPCLRKVLHIYCHSYPLSLTHPHCNIWQLYLSFFLPFSSKYNFQEVSVWPVQPLLACCCPTRCPQCDVLLTFDKWKKRRAAVSTLNSQQRVICESESKFLYPVWDNTPPHSTGHLPISWLSKIWDTVGQLSAWWRDRIGYAARTLWFCPGSSITPSLWPYRGDTYPRHSLSHWKKWAFWNNQLISFLKHNIWI